MFVQKIVFLLFPIYFLYPFLLLVTFTMALPENEHDTKQLFYFKQMLAHFVNESVFLLKIYIPALILGEDLRACFLPRITISLIS